MPEAPMEGATAARRYLADYLASDLPPLLAWARQQRNTPDWMLPDPVVYDSYDPMVAHAYPTIGSIVRSSSNWRRRDIVEGAEHYSARYRVTLFVYVETPVNSVTDVYPDDTYSATLRQRDDMLALVRSCLLTKPSFNSQGMAEMDENTLTEEYLDAMKVSKESPAWIAGGTIGFEMIMSEANRNAPLGIAETFNIEGHSIQGEMQ